jgi:eukaryotic-like serine/threonine-protein kinase
MNPDDVGTRVISGGGSRSDLETITISTNRPARLDDLATIEDARLTSSESDVERPAPPAHVRYVIVGEAGRGGMATVHVARDVDLLRNVALKQLSIELQDVDQARLRFLREVQVSAQLDHPYIVPVYGLEVAPGGSPAYAMKLVEGHTLLDYLNEACAAYSAGGEPDEDHSLPARIEHLIKVCEAIHYAHGKGVIHRDLKPSNIMLGAHGETYLMDWGVCRLVGTDDSDPAIVESPDDSGDGAQTEYGTVVGTPRYMSPEQAQGRIDEMGPHSDQCALGLMLFEIVTLKAPFDGRNTLEVMKNAAAGRRATLAHSFERRPIAAPLRAIIDRATRYDPQQRYASVNELADDLRRYLRGEAVHALPDTSWQRAQRYVGRHRQGMLLSLLGLIAVAALGFTFLMWRSEQLAQAARDRETLERDLIEHVAREGDKLQLRLALVQSKLEALALAATQLVQFGTTDSGARTYWAEDFANPTNRPSDFGLDAKLGREVSLDSAVWSSAPGIEPKTLLPIVQRLSNLRGYRNQLLDVTRRNLGGGQYASGVLELQLVLEQGLFMRYPGRVLEGDEDLRQNDWYRDIKVQAESTWGQPHVDNEGDDVLLPLSSPMRDPDGNFLGALSMDLALDFVAHNLLRTNDGDDLILLDADGRLLASEDLCDAKAPRSGMTTLAPFGDATIRAAFKNDEVGTVATRMFGRPQIISFDHINPLGWILVLVADDPQAK